MKLLIFTIAICAIAASSFLTSGQPESDRDVLLAVSGNQENSGIARLTINGVEVQINQIQIQRIGSAVQLQESLGKLMPDGSNLKRTIAISISQKGQGTTSGPISITLQNGDQLRPCLQGNQRFMNFLANAGIPPEFDFMESWFKVPAETRFEDIFPVTVSYKSTDANEKPVEFEFENIHP